MLFVIDCLVTLENNRFFVFADTITAKLVDFAVGVISGGELDCVLERQCRFLSKKTDFKVTLESPH